jgi:hypothetical protein
MDRAATIRKAIEILEGPNAEDTLRESMSDLAFLIELGALEVNVAHTLQCLTEALEEPWTATDVARQFGAYSTARRIVEVTAPRP